MGAWELNGGDSSLPPGTNLGRLITSAAPGSGPVLAAPVDIFGPTYVMSLPLDTTNIFDTTKAALISVGCAHKDQLDRNVWTENRGTVISYPGRPAIVHGRLTAEKLEVHFLIGTQAGLDTVFANTGVDAPLADNASCDLWMNSYPGMQQTGALGSGQVPPLGQEQYLKAGSANIDPGSSVTTTPLRSYSGVADLNYYSDASPVRCTLNFYGMILTGVDRGDMTATGQLNFARHGQYEITLPTDVVTATFTNVGSANTNVDYSILSRVHSI